MTKRYKLQIICMVVGVVLGYLILHPYTMLILSLLSAFQWEPLRLQTDLTIGHLVAFHPLMLPMAISFSLFGSFIGLLVGILLNRKRELWIADHENEKKRVAIETLREVMVTLSHHLLNANMIIGGKVRHCRKATSDEKILAALEIIEEQGRKIDAVVGALRRATEVKVAHYTLDGTVRMIDIEHEIKEELSSKRSAA
jgi:hypothetical protein